MCDSQTSEKNGRRAPALACSRRWFLLLAAGLAAGCSRQTLTRMPPPPWEVPLNGTVPTQDPLAGPGRGLGKTAAASWQAGVLSRSLWARERPAPARMNRMTTIRYITVHHDGMDPFYGTDIQSVAAHLEQIRQLHRNKGWGDIGYHFAIDRAGRVWEGRPLLYQGAHVKDHNPGNIGVVALGNFETQMPSQPQLAALKRQLRVLMRAFAVPPARVHTHQEWQGAATACPGGRLQEFLETTRRNGGLG